MLPRSEVPKSLHGTYSVMACTFMACFLVDAMAKDGTYSPSFPIAIKKAYRNVGECAIYHEVQRHVEVGDELKPSRPPSLYRTIERKHTYGKKYRMFATLGI